MAVAQVSNAGQLLQGSGASLQGPAPSTGGGLQVTQPGSNLQFAPNPQNNNVNPQNGQTLTLDPASPEAHAATAAAASAATKAQISNAFANALAGYDAQQADLDRQKSVNEKTVDDQFNSDKGTLNLGFNQGNDNLDRSEDKVDYTKASSLRELGQNMAAAMNSRTQQIGSLGGGSSSANLGLALALHGVQAQGQSGLIDQAQIQYGDIDNSRKQLKETYDDNAAKLDLWKNNQITQIAQSYITQKGAIDRARAGANTAQLQALNQMSVQLAQQAAGQLAQVQAALPTIDTSGSKAIGQVGNDLAQTTYNVSALQGANPTVTYSGGQVNNDQSPIIYRKTDDQQ